MDIKASPGPEQNSSLAILFNLPGQGIPYRIEKWPARMRKQCDWWGAGRVYLSLLGDCSQGWETAGTDLRGKGQWSQAEDGAFIGGSATWGACGGTAESKLGLTARPL